MYITSVPLSQCHASVSVAPARSEPGSEDQVRESEDPVEEQQEVDGLADGTASEEYVEEMAEDTYGTGKKVIESSVQCVHISLQEDGTYVERRQQSTGNLELVLTYALLRDILFVLCPQT